MKNTLLIIFVVLIVAAGALFVYYKSSLEKEATERAKIQLEQARLNVQKADSQEARLDACLAEAERKHWEYLSINGKVSTDEKTGREKVQAPQYVWDNADAAMKDDKDNCFRRYQK